MTNYTHSDLNADRAFAESLVGSVAAVFRRLAGVGAGFNRMRERARALSELARMSDTELTDLGLARSDLPHLFDGSFQSNRGI